MKITNIKPQLKRTDRYSVYVDDKYAFSLGEVELLAAGLRLNQEMSKEQLAALMDIAKLDKAYDRTLNYIAIRRRSEWEVRQYLKRKSYEPEIIEAILSRLSAKGYIDDTVFAKVWVENRRLLKSTSKRRLQQELRAKRVDDYIIQQVLTEDDTDEREVLKELIAKKRQQSRYQDNLKLMQYLSRQGYNFDDIKSVMSEFDTDV